VQYFSNILNMNTTLAIMAILAIVAAVGAVATLTSINLVQQAEAASCQTLSRTVCSSDTSFDHAAAVNLNQHLKRVR
jgi:hypothetical protein